MEITGAASLLHDGRRIPVDGEATLGRSEDNAVVVADERASRRHARVFVYDGGFVVADLGSRHGTFVNGERISDEPRPLEPGDAIEVGDQLIRFLSGEHTRMASREQEVVAVQTVDFAGKRLTLGRDPKNGVVLVDPNVSRFHAELRRNEDGSVELVDLGSRNGTRLNGELTAGGPVRPGAEIGIGPFQIVFDGQSLTARDDSGSLRLDATDVSMKAGDKTILHPTSISIEPGELVALIGESGAGKTTLLKALAGVHRPTGGRITLNGEPLATRLTDVGYVPQDEIVHRLLDVEEALRYAARLRLPQDVSDEEMDAAVQRVLDELSLVEQADTRIGSLSGGQRKRTGVATELLSRPSVLFLDEPTTGLDPGLETQTMQLLRELSRGGRAVAVVTHATKNLALCDRVVVMGRGGYLTFDGKPQEALRFFGVEDYDGIYTVLPTRAAEEWGKRFHDTAERPVPKRSQAPTDPEGHPRPSPIPQLGVLVSRYLRLFARDRRNLALLVGQAPVLALFGVALFESGIFDKHGGDPGNGVSMLFLMALTVIWLGAIDAAPEIVKERGVVEREAAIGTRLSAYIVSKLIVLFGLVGLQTLLYAGLLLAFRPLSGEGVEAYVVVLGLLTVTGFTAICMGLLVSSLVTSQDQAMSLIPLAVIPQLLFAGSIVPLDRMGGPARAIANAIFGQWSLAGLGTAIDMNDRLAANPATAKANRFGTDFFDLSAGAAFAAQGIFLLVFLSGVVLILHRRLRV